MAFYGSRFACLVMYDENKLLSMRTITVFFLWCVSAVVFAQTSKYKVVSGDNLYGIAKRYNVTVADLAKANNLSTNTGLRIGQVLVIPGKNQEAKVNPANVASTVNAQLHVVASGESLYSIAKKYGVTVKDIQQWNNMNDANVKPGQRLVVNKNNTAAIYKPVNVPSTPDTPYTEEDNRTRASYTEVPIEVISTEPVTSKTATDGLRTVSSVPAEYPAIFSNYANTYKIKKVRGAANYLADNTSGNQFLAFYSGVETGSIIRVTNLMNKKTIYVKVVGKTPPADAAMEIVVKLSKKAAEELGALDEKFLVEVAGYTAN